MQSHKAQTLSSFFFLPLLLFTFYTSLTYIVITYEVTWQNFRTNISLTVADPVKGPGPYF